MSMPKVHKEVTHIPVPPTMTVDGVPELNHENSDAQNPG